MQLATASLSSGKHDQLGYMAKFWGANFSSIRIAIHGACRSPCAALVCAFETLAPSRSSKTLLAARHTSSYNLSSQSVEPQPAQGGVLEWCSLIDSDMSCPPLKDRPHGSVVNLSTFDVCSIYVYYSQHRSSISTSIKMHSRGVFSS